MRFRIIPSAYKHGIDAAEIAAVLSNPRLCVSADARLEGASLVLFIGAPAVNEPDIEVIADLAADPAVVFHAMMLRPTQVAKLGIEHYPYHFAPNYARQRR
ncbi:hypothetical protein ACFXK0_21295 [Nocardia sp. NPDC059177]|uniref:hypothetical protein n=1 Tax=Nocardia sp. NPDC059177 TaxID=3346759 RepID=UPI0036913ADE